MKVVLVTGANSGIGYETCVGLAKANYKVVMLCRNLELAKKAKEEIINETQNQNIEIIQIDLGDLESIQTASKEILEKYPKIDALVNNAGVFYKEFTETGNNLETQFAVNHLGHFLLTKLLMPALKNAEEARVVSVASVAHSFFTGSFYDELKAANLELKGLEARKDFSLITKKNFQSFRNYGKTKLANMLFTSELKKRLKDEGVSNIKVYSLHPGVISSTRIVRTMDNLFFNIITKPLLYLTSISPKEGAETTLHCVTSQEVANYDGWYFSKKSPVKDPYQEPKNIEAGSILWDLSENLIF